MHANESQRRKLVTDKTINFKEYNYMEQIHISQILTVKMIGFSVIGTSNETLRVNRIFCKMVDIWVLLHSSDDICIIMSRDVT